MVTMRWTSRSGVDIETCRADLGLWLGERLGHVEGLSNDQQWSATM